MKKLPLLVTLVLLASSPVLAGVVYEIETTDHNATSSTTQTSVEGRNLAMGIHAGARGSNGEAIYRGDRNEMVIVDHDNKSYFVMDQEMIESIAGQVGQAMGQIEKALENVPEAQRAALEQMMRDRMPQKPPTRPETTLRNTGDRAEKNGYPCVRYEVLRGGTVVRELWVTDWSNVEGGQDVAPVFEDLADFFGTMLDSLSGADGMPGLGDALDDNMFEHMKELGGFPVVTREFDDDGSLEGETTLRSARRQTIDPDAFEPPAGYKRQEMFGGR